MNGVISSYHAYNGPPEPSQDVGVPFAGLSARMATKRKRPDASEYGSAAAPGGWDQQSQQAPQQQYAPQMISSFGSHAGGNVDYSGNAAAGGAPSAATHDPSAAASLSESSDPNGQWNSSGASPYPEISSYSQQPYFYQQTDPSTYNSPWPPAESASFGTSQANSYSGSGSGPTAIMPFFPPQTPAEPSETTLDTTNTVAQPFQSYTAPETDSSAQYPPYLPTSSNGQSRSEVQAPQSAFYLEDASMHLKIQSLPILDNLATQLIHTIAKASYPQIQEIMRGNENEDGQAYTTLKSLFDQTRKVYSRETPFIDAIAIQMFQPNQQEIIRKANIATFISSILGAHDVSFFHLNEFFMETFVPLGHRLLKWQGAIYLELKTQSYISALINSDGSPEAMLDELFPPDLDAQILTRHPDAPSLSPSEQDFIDRSRSRKSYLLAEDSADEALRELPKKYQWQDFVREFASCISKNVDGIMNVPARAQPVFGSNSLDRRSGATQDSASRNNPAGAIASSAIPGVQSLSLNGQGGQSTSTAQPNAPEPSSRKPAPPSSTIRQPWTKPEEDALLSGLDRVNGPHWSQILALYGRGGSVSEVLKDRNQVQLKDKARNLKLWYLKMGKDVPSALRGVTGELRKRGGARARAALGIAEDEGLEGGEDGEADGDGADGGLERGNSRSGKGSIKKKGSKKGS